MMRKIPKLQNTSVYFRPNKKIIVCLHTFNNGQKKRASFLTKENNHFYTIVLCIYINGKKE